MVGKKECNVGDSVVLWHAYPRIGLDDLNQFDFYRHMPGGLKGLRAVVDELQAAGIKVFIDCNPWDTGTRRENVSDLDALCEMIRALDADGIFLDTMKEGAAAFRAKLHHVSRFHHDRPPQYRQCPHFRSAAFMPLHYPLLK